MLIIYVDFTMKFKSEDISSACFGPCHQSSFLYSVLNSCTNSAINKKFFLQKINDIRKLTVLEHNHVLFLDLDAVLEVRLGLETVSRLIRPGQSPGFGLDELRFWSGIGLSLVCLNGNNEEATIQFVKNAILDPG